MSLRRAGEQVKFPALDIGKPEQQRRDHIKRRAPAECEYAVAMKQEESAKAWRAFKGLR
jgi:hypothetical protein